MTHRSRALALSIVLVLSSLSATLYFAPDARAGSCLYCVSEPFTVTTGHSTIKTGCGHNTDIVYPQAQTTGVSTITEESFVCNVAPNAGGHSQVKASAGYNSFMWTSSVSRSVTVTMFWNVSYLLNVSATCPTTGFTEEAEVQINGSAYDGSTGTAIPGATTTVHDLNPATCSTSASAVQNSPAAYTVSFSFTATNLHVYYFDTRLLTLTDVSFNQATPALSIDAVANVGSGHSATLSTLEVY